VLAAFAAAQLGLGMLDRPATWDEAVYVGIGKHLFSGGEVGLYEPIRPLVIPFLSGLAWKAGLDPVAASRVLALLFALGALAMTYRLVRAFGGAWPAVAAAALMAITPVFFLNATSILTEIPSLFFLLAAMDALLAQRAAGGGALAGLAFLTKFPHALAFAALLACLVAGRRMRPLLPRAAAGLAAVLVPALVLHALLAGSPVRPLVLAARHAANLAYAAGSPIQDAFFYALEPVRDNILLAFAALGLLLQFRAGRQDPRKALVLLPLLALMTYFTLIPNQQLRFALLFLPLLAALAALGIARIVAYATRQRAPLARVAAGLLLALAAVAGVLVAASGFAQRPVPAEADATLHNILGRSPGIILTTDPVPAAYVDRKFVPFYFYRYDERNASAVYEQEKDRAGLVLFAPDVFACDRYPEPTCAEMVLGVWLRIATQGTPVFARSGRPYLVYAGPADLITGR
jgi:4-amino-4-deoxy-L-arabinose transferase-like glycosyltransferase